MVLCECNLCRQFPPYPVSQWQLVIVTRNHRDRDLVTSVVVGWGTAPRVAARSTTHALSTSDTPCRSTPSVPVTRPADPVMTSSLSHVSAATSSCLRGACSHQPSVCYCNCHNASGHNCSRRHGTVSPNIRRHRTSLQTGMLLLIIVVVLPVSFLTGCSAEQPFHHRFRDDARQRRLHGQRVIQVVTDRNTAMVSGALMISLCLTKRFLWPNLVLWPPFSLCHVLMYISLGYQRYNHDQMVPSRHSVVWATY